MTDYEKRLKLVINESIRVAKRGIVVYVPYTHFQLFARLIPDWELITIHKKTSTVIKSKKNVLQHAHYLMTTAKAVKPVKNVWDDIRVPDDGFFFKEKRYGHPAPTSLKVMKRIIKHYTEKGETVIDPFVGSGATVEACSILGRNCVGIDLNQKYITNMAFKRIKHDNCVITLGKEVPGNEKYDLLLAGRKRKKERFFMNFNKDYYTIQELKDQGWIKMKETFKNYKKRKKLEKK